MTEKDMAIKYIKKLRDLAAEIKEGAPDHLFDSILMEFAVQTLKYITAKNNGLDADNFNEHTCILVHDHFIGEVCDFLRQKAGVETAINPIKH